jgi:uncharacterized protein YoxC
VELLLNIVRREIENTPIGEHSDSIREIFGNIVDMVKAVETINSAVRSIAEGLVKETDMSDLK